MRYMKAFRKGNSQREFHQRFRSQSAMEYLMTYGWAILIIAVVLAALFELGVFNPITFAPKASPGSCQVVRPEGAGTTNFISLEGECNGELPQYVASSRRAMGSVIQISVADLPVGASPRTVTAWINILGDPNLNDVFFYYGNGGSGGSFSLWYGGDQPYRVIVDTWNYVSVSPGDAIKNEWVFVAGGYNNGNVIGYIGENGKLSGPVTAAAPNANTASSTVYISGGTGQSFNGSIANIQLYNTSLSQPDIQALYQEGIGGAPIKIQNLVGWWPLNGNANDYSGNGNNGVPSGITYTSNWYSGYSAP